jgi:hypothetical protein
VRGLEEGNTQSERSTEMEAGDEVGYSEILRRLLKPPAIHIDP